MLLPHRRPTLLCEPGYGDKDVLLTKEIGQSGLHFSLKIYSLPAYSR